MDVVEQRKRRWHVPRWWELAPEAVLAVGLGWFFFDEMDAAASAFKSSRAVALMVGAMAAWMVGRLLAARFVPWPSARLAPFALAAVAVLAVVVLPAYRNHRVVEQLSVESIGSEASEQSATPAASADEREAQAPAGTPSVPPARPVPIRSGRFEGIDHRAHGTVTIYERADGRHVIGLEDFDIQPGPDYDVYLVPGTDRTDTGEGTRVDDLRGNAGTQYYDAPESLDVGTGAWTVLIWCQTFGVPVANATPV